MTSFGEKSPEETRNIDHGENKMAKKTITTMVPIVNFGTRNPLIVKIRKAALQAAHGNVFKAAHSAWDVNQKRVNGRDVVVVTLEDNIIQDVFEIDRWTPIRSHPKKDGKMKRDWAFSGKSVASSWAKPWIGSRIPSKYIGARRTFRYVN